MALPQLVPMDTVALADGWLYSDGRSRRRAGREEEPVAELSLRGETIPMRRLTRVSWALENQKRQVKSAIRCRVQSRLHELCSICVADHIRAFITLASNFGLHDVMPLSSSAGGTEEISVGLHIERLVNQLAMGIKIPKPPDPSLQIRGSLYHLHREDPPPSQGSEGTLRVKTSVLRVASVGEPLAPAESLLPATTEALTAVLAERLTRIIHREEIPHEDVVAVQGELTKFGAARRGDLLLIAGSPFRLGAVLPDHHSRVFSRKSSGDLAVAQPFDLLEAATLPGGPLIVHERDAATGFWRERRVPTCPGSFPANRVLPEDPAVATASRLRFAAVRFATEGLFHSQGYR